MLSALSIAAAAAAMPDETKADEQLRPLTVEDLGVPVRTMRRVGEYLVPKPGGRGWWFLTSYNPVKRNTMPLQVYIVDLDTKDVTTRELMPSGALCHTINSKGLTGLDGKFYIGHYAKMGIWRFDPEDGSLEWIDFPEIPDRILPFCLQMSPSDGKIYLGTASAKAYLVEFDPQNEQFRNFGIQGPKHPAPRYIYYMAVGTRYVYTAAGKSPWYLVATDRETMDQKVLLRDPEYVDCYGRGDECFARVKLKSHPDGPVIQKTYRLRNGAAFEYDPTAVKTPPRPKPPPKPELLLTLARPNSEGKAQVWFRKPGQDWDRVELEGIQTTPWKFLALKALPNGRLLGAPSAYEDFFAYDPKKNQTTILGKSPLSAYSMECLGGRVFITGYPGTYLVEYDPAKPWTYFTSTPEYQEPELNSPESNPRECHRLGEFTNTHHARATAIGADGLLYIGGHAERLHVGGGIMWWDPTKRRAGGLREPFLVQDCAGLAAAREGKLMVYSSKPVTDPRGQIPTPKEAELFVLDVTTRRITSKIVPLPELRSCGPIVAAGDRVYGVGLREGGHVFYVVDLAAEKTVFAKPINVKTSNLKFGSDGKLYTFIGEVLTRIDIDSLAFESLGAVENTASFEFLGSDLYLTGTSLRRIRNVTALPGVSFSLSVNRQTQTE